MFTGIIEDVGEVVSLTKVPGGARASISTDLVGSLRPGESIAVDGCCLTVTGREKGAFLADLSEETLSRTSFGDLQSGGKVNLERAMPADGRFGGHIVQGHVDAVGRIRELRADGDTRVVSVEVPPGLLPFLAEKGSIAVAGVSLTVNRVLPAGFAVTLIPFTLSHTSLGSMGEGAKVNLEADVIAKYVARAAEAYLPKERSRA